MNRKTYLLIAALFIILTILILVSLFYKPKNKDNNGILPVPSENISPIDSQTILQNAQFRVAQVILGQNNVEPVPIDETVIVVFNKPINPEKTDYEINPSVKLVTELDQTATKFSVRGDPFWPNKTSFILIIKSGSQAQDGSILEKDYPIRFETRLLEETAE